jgi:hypothetical protein
MTQEKYLKFFSVLHELSEWAKFVIVGRLPQVVCALGYFTAAESFSIDGVPIYEQILNRAVIG